MRGAIGTILPSSNRNVERTLAAALAYFPMVDFCHARIPYWGDGLGQPAEGYDASSYREAARLLGHAGVEVVYWNGCKGAALAAGTDQALAALLADAAGCPATTTVLATATLLERFGARRIAVVAQGSAADAAAHGRGFGAETVATRGLGLRDNRAAGAVPPERLAALVREAAVAGRPDAVLLWSTNQPGFAAIAGLEAALGIRCWIPPRSASGAYFDAIGIDPRPAACLGRIFTLGQ